jgi:hypothetical protein
MNTLSGDLSRCIRLYVMCIYGLCVGSSEDVPQFMFFYELISLVWYGIGSYRTIDELDVYTLFEDLYITCWLYPFTLAIFPLQV